jgi:site-specific DNA recombinase
MRRRHRPVSAPTATTTKRVVIYTRVSTKDQADNLSLPVQEKACLEYCRREGYEVDWVFSEAASAKTAEKRDQFQEMLRYCQRNQGKIYAVVVYAMTRFSRNLPDVIQVAFLMKQVDVVLRSATENIDETASGEFMRNITAAVAQYDNHVRSDRTKTGMKATLESGKWVHQAPLGYISVPTALSGGGLVHDPDRAPIVLHAFELFATGSYSKQQVLDIVTAEGLRTKTNKKISPQTFDNLLRNSLYYGCMSVPEWGLRVRGKFDPLITEELFKRVQAKLSGGDNPVVEHKRSNADFPLRIFAKCKACNTSITGSKSTGKLGGKYSYYACPNKECRAFKARQEHTHGQFIDYLDSLRPHEAYWPLFEEVVRDIWRQRMSLQEETLAAASKRVEELDDKKSRLVDALIYGKISQSIYDDQLAKVESELAVSQMDAFDARLDDLEVERVLTTAHFILEHASGTWFAADLDRKQRIQSVLFPQGVTLSKEGFGTPQPHSFFNNLGDAEMTKSSLASPEGFEPSLPP